MSDYPMLISNKLHSFRNFSIQNYQKKTISKRKFPKIFFAYAYGMFRSSSYALSAFFIR